MFTQHTNTNKKARSGAIIGAAAVAATLAGGTAARAQEVKVQEVTPAQAGASAARGAGEQMVLDRAARMLGAARERQAGGPVGARQAYRSAEDALLQMFAAAGQNTPQAIPAGSGLGSLTPAQAVQDIKALRARGMDRAANFYATAAKEFFTGQLREALLEGGPAANQVARVQSVAYAKTGQRGPTIVIRGDQSDRQQALAQGQQALRDAQDAERARQREQEAAAIAAAQQQQQQQQQTAQNGYPFYPYAAGGGTLPWSVPGAFYNPFTPVPIYGQQPLTYGALPPGSIINGPGGTTVTPTFFGGGFGYPNFGVPYGGGFFGLPY